MKNVYMYPYHWRKVIFILKMSKTLSSGISFFFFKKKKKEEGVSFFFRVTSVVTKQAWRHLHWQLPGTHHAGHVSASTADAVDRTTVSFALPISAELQWFIAANLACSPYSQTLKGLICPLLSKWPPTARSPTGFTGAIQPRSIRSISLRRAPCKALPANL